MTNEDDGLMQTPEAGALFENVRALTDGFESDLTLEKFYDTLLKFGVIAARFHEWMSKNSDLSDKWIEAALLVVWKKLYGYDEYGVGSDDDDLEG